MRVLGEDGTEAGSSAPSVKPFGRGCGGSSYSKSWEGAALSRAETVLRGTTHHTVRAAIGYGEKVSRRLWSKKLEEGIGLTASHKDTERPEGPRAFELERVVPRISLKPSSPLDLCWPRARELRLQMYIHLCIYIQEANHGHRSRI